MKVQLVTHSIIPNLNSGLVPIDPVDLVQISVSGPTETKEEKTSEEASTEAQ